MPNPWVLPLSFGISLLLLSGLGYLALAAVHTRNIALCWRCGATKVRPSRSRSIDKLAACFALRPYRCAGCLTRFYAFRTSSPVTAMPVVQPVLVTPHTGGNRFPIRVKVIVRLPWPTDWKSAWELLLAEEQGFIAAPRDNRARLT